MNGQVFPCVTLTTERLVLRPFTSADAADVYAVWNDDLYVRFVPAGFASAGADLDHAAKWCTYAVEEWRLLGQGVSFAAEERDSARLVSHVALFGTDWISMITEIHYWTAAWGRGQGYASEAVRAVSSWALTDQRFARIALAAVTSNTASRRVAEAAGFRFEGVLRNATVTRTGREDLGLYSRIPQDLLE